MDAYAIRELRADDAPHVQDFVRRLSPEARLKRFFAPINELTDRQLARVTADNGADHVSLAAFDGAGRIVGLAEFAVEDGAGGEFGVVVEDRLQRSGLGTRLIGQLLERARERGLAALNGLVLYDNWPMLNLAAKLGFELWEDSDPALMRVERTLDSGRMQPPAGPLIQRNTVFPALT